MLILHVFLFLINIALASMTVSVLLAACIPSFDSFFKYGKTLPSKPISHSLHLPYDFQDIYVPKIWFTHFYIIHFLLSIINILVFFIVDYANKNVCSDLQLIICFNLIQSGRRLYECLYVSKFSNTAKIHIFHYLVGVIFYTSINIIPLLMHYTNEELPLQYSKCILSILLFITASYDQYNNHNLLANQKKYTLPTTALFKYVVCPHYFDEVLIYLSIFIIKPTISFFIVFAWVFINLTISAQHSYKFYTNNKEVDISNHCIIIPYIY